MKRIIIALIAVMMALPLSAAYITAAVGEDLYIIDDKTGEAIWRVNEGKRYPVQDGNLAESEYPIKSDYGTFSKYGLDYSLRAKFTDSTIYVNFDISKGLTAMDPVIDDLLDSSSYFYIECYDEDGFLLTKEMITLDGATRRVDSEANPTGLYVNKEFESSEDIRQLVSYIECTYSISSSITPAAPLLDIPYWLIGKWNSEYDEYTFTATDLIFFDDSVRASISDMIKDGEENVFQEDVTDSSYSLTLDGDTIRFTKTDNPDLILVNEEYDQYFILRDGATFSLDPFDEIPDWLKGDWLYLENETELTFSDDDFYDDGDSLKDEWSKAYLYYGGTIEISDSLIDDVYTIAIVEDGMTYSISFEKTDNNNFVLVSASDGEQAELVRSGSESISLNEIPDYLKGIWIDCATDKLITISDSVISEDGKSLKAEAVEYFINYGGDTVISDKINEDGSYSVSTAQVTMTFSRTDDENIIAMIKVINGVKSPQHLMLKNGTTPDFGKLDSIPDWLIGHWTNPEIEFEFHNDSTASMNGEDILSLVQSAFYNDNILIKLEDERADDGSYIISAGNISYTFSPASNTALLTVTDSNGNDYLLANVEKKDFLASLDEIPDWLIGTWKCTSPEWEFTISEDDFSESGIPSWKEKALDEYLANGGEEVLSDSYLRGTYVINTPEKEIRFSRTGTPDNLMVTAIENGNVTYMEAVRN
ncbi:MAG: hypothetical protein IAA97_07695 [Spirochaetes bacterium]|uniref:Uncharacterized protein n=1 Tax=Candidatus Ornithospirochaeta stercoripullorum TaxID=2840899 RepID=A0A9D9E1L6_9SPIO|nr:hypothetical protein [Candidatus Ornithospirochaeta stercoripullorum]